MPESGPATIVHGDFRLGNTLYAPGAPARLAAVLDWEMATIGDPLADLGYLCMMWTEADDPSGGMRDALGAVTRAEGFPTRAEVIAAYEQRSGRSMSDIRWYMTLALWKSVVFMEGNYKRAVAGTTDDPYLKTFGEGVLELARQAEAVAHGA
jgi:aminoglycoside phosphotransferase (APT) family kinase protein